MVVITCTQCGTDFEKHHPSGRQCKDCVNERRRELRKTGVKQRVCDQCGVTFRSGSGRARYCSTCIGDTTEEGMRWRQSIKLYGVDKFMYEAMYFEQDGKCMICEDREAKAVDHCHDSGRPRGLLCLGCNTMVGFMETPGRLDKALEYIADGKY